MGPGTLGAADTPYVCSECAGRIIRLADEQGVPKAEGLYCLACGFHTNRDESIEVIKGRVCRPCALKIGAGLQ